MIDVEFLIYDLYAKSLFINNAHYCILRVSFQLYITYLGGLVYFYFTTTQYFKSLFTSA